MGQGYPPKDAKRKQLNTKQVKQLNKICKLSFEQVLAQIPSDLLDPILNYAPVYDFLMQNGQNPALNQMLDKAKHKL